MLPGIDPQQLQRVQSVSKNIKGSIRIDYKENTVLLEFKTDVDGAKQMIPNMMSQFADSLATQLSSFFAIQGEIIEINKTSKE